MFTIHLVYILSGFGPSGYNLPNVYSESEKIKTGNPF